MNKLSNIVAIIGGLILPILLGSAPVYAQITSIGVSPMVTSKQLKSAQARASFSVTNYSQVPIRTRIYAQDFDYDKEKGYVKIDNHPYSANPYLQFSPRELVIAPGATREVRVNITIPPSKPDGEYRVAVFTEDLTERKIVDPNTKYITIVRAQFGSVFFVTKGSIAPELSAINVRWNPTKNEPQLLLKNQGQASAYPEINWQLKQENTEIARSSIYGIVLQAGKERAIDLQITPEKKLTPGNYTLVGEIDNKDGKTVPFSLSVTVPVK